MRSPPVFLRLQLPISFPGLGHVNCYIMEDSRGVALVDPGLPGIRTWRHLKKSLKSIGIPITRVHTVVVTHSHPDHFGQIGRLKKGGWGRDHLPPQLPYLPRPRGRGRRRGTGHHRPPAGSRDDRTGR